MLCVTHRGRVKALDEWARKAVLEEADVSDAWKPSAERWPRDPLFQAPSIYSPLIHAHKRVKWTVGALDSIGLAIQAWRGDGHVSGLKGALLKNYVYTPPLGPRVDRKTTPPPRYRTRAVVRVAHMLLNHGAKLRQLLNLEEDSADAMPMHMVLERLEAENATLKAALLKEQAAAKRLQDAWRKAAGRLKKKNQAVTEARRDERAKACEAVRQRAEAQQSAALARKSRCTTRPTPEPEKPRLRQPRQGARWPSSRRRSRRWRRSLSPMTRMMMSSRT